MSSHDTFMTGRRPRPHLSSSGLCLQPPADTHMSQSANVTSNSLTASGLVIVTLCTGFSSEYSSEPIMKSPAGITTISGHSGQSLKVSFGFRQRISLLTWASVPSHGEGEGAACEGFFASTGAGTLGGAATATCCFNGRALDGTKQ